MLEGWRTAVIPRIVIDLRSDMPEINGLLERNIGCMIAFFLAYPARWKFCHSPWLLGLEKKSQSINTKTTPKAIRRSTGSRAPNADLFELQ